MNILIENSTIDNKPLNEVFRNLYETTNTSNITSYQGLITSIIQKVAPEAKLADICSVIETKIPSGKIPYLHTYYTGKSSNITDNIKILTVLDSSVFIEDGDISTLTATGEVLHVEENKILVKVLSGMFSANDDIDNAIPFVSSKTNITSVYNAIHSVGTLLPNYGGQYSTLDGETLIDYKELEYKIGTIDINCTTSKIVTGYTIEAFQDLLHIYGENFKEVITKSLSNIISTLEQQKVFAFQRANAAIQPNIVLPDSYGIQGNLADVYNDLYSRANQSIRNIKTKTGISGTFAVIASSNVYAALRSTKDIADVDKRVLNNRAVLVEDSYAVKDYMLVSLIGPDNNGAVMYIPYSYELKEVTDPVTFQTHILAMVRRDIKNNPLATLQTGKNEMMELSYVDGYLDLVNTG